MLGLAALDWGVIGMYGALVLGVGWWANRRQRDSEDYFLGGRRLRWWAVGVSLVATSFSAVSLIGGTGFGYARGLGWLQLQIGDLLAVVAVCLLFLPFYAGLRLTTAYEYLERRFGVVARVAASALFIGQTLVRAGTLLVPPALALATILHWPLWVAIAVTAAAAILYSAFGGISAVVWTDLVQMAIVVFGVVYCLWLVAGDVPGGADAILAHARAHGKLEAVSLAPDGGSLFNLVGACVPYAVFAVSLFGTNQQAVQRFLSCKDLGAARRAALAGWAVGTLALGLMLLLGVFLAVWVAEAPAAAGASGLEGDRALPGFIAERLPAGIAGLLLAAIFAAAMSSLDSAIHSTSTAAIVDFGRRFSRRPPDGRRELAIARATTGACGVVATLIAVRAAEAQGGILQTMVVWLGYFAGPLLGLFLLGLLSRRANEPGALIGAGTALAGVAAAAAGAGGGTVLGLHPLWLAPLSCAATLLVGWGASWGWPAPAATRLRGLTLGFGLHWEAHSS